jgi:hypothetical protein
MRTIHFRSLSVAALALLAFAGTATAQDKSALLNTFEVQQLVKRAEPADNARLAAHFTALAERYTAEATRHASMSQSFVGNPSRNSLGAGMSAHCKRLADLNTQSATTVRELAGYHQKLAAGALATPPRDSSRFQGGAGAADPTEPELKALAAKANTPAEHHVLEEYFLTAAKRYTADANEHAATASAYRGTRIAQAAAHCDRLVTLSREEAKEATEAAAMHKQLGGIAR